MTEAAKKYSILYAEDMTETRENYGAFLEGMFRQVIYAKDGHEAWDLYREKKPDILLLDINMPGIDGLSLAKNVRKEDKECKIVMLTAHAEQEKLLLATELHLTRYLLKPVTRKDFKEALNKAVDELEEERRKNELVVLSDEYVWNKPQGSLLYNQEEVALTKSERLVMKLLVSKRKNIYSLDDFNSYFKKNKSNKPLTEDGLKGIIKRLRKKLPEFAIDNIFGVGYRLSIYS